MDELQDTCSALFEQVYEQQPTPGALVTPDGETVYIYRDGGWKPICPVVSGVPGERVEFEIYPDLVIESDPAGLMEVLLVIQGIDPKHAIETAKLFFKIIKETGWKGPVEQLPSTVPGDVYVDWHDYADTQPVIDIRPVLSQLKDPNFNGILVAEKEDGEIYAWNMKDIKTVSVQADPEEDPEEDADPDGSSH